MKKTGMFLLASISVLILPGCQAPRGLQHEVAAPQVVVDKQKSEELQQFAKTLVEQPMGSVEVSNSTHFGSAQMSKDREYVNGLGEMCYRFTVTTENDRQHIAVCRGKDQQWRYVELVH